MPEIDPQFSHEAVVDLGGLDYEGLTRLDEQAQVVPVRPSRGTSVPMARPSRSTCARVSRIATACR